LIARQLALASTEGVGHMLRSCRQTATPKELNGHEPLLLRSFATALVASPMQQRIDRLTDFLVQTVEQQWLSHACPSEWRRLDRPSEAEMSLPNLSAHDGPAALISGPPGSSATQSEEWRARFGDHAQTRFSFEVLSRVCRQSPLRDAYRSAMLSSTNPAQFVAFATQALSAISSRRASSPTTTERLSDADQSFADKLASSSHRVLTKLIDEIELMPTDARVDAAPIERIVRIECAAAVEECLAREAPGGALVSGPTIQDQAQQALDRANVELLQCGYDRRTLIVVPARDKRCDVIESIMSARPTAAVVTADVEEPVVVSEGAGVSPSSFARGLERVYPGIAEASKRHFTRIDIDWSAWSL
jgi:hypothetical protein